MHLVDSSVWIDYFSGTDTAQSDKLDTILGTELAAFGDFVLTEVLQGFRADKDYAIAKARLAELILLDMFGERMAGKSAESFRKLRNKGITIRKTADVIIASFCIDKKLPLLFSDQDFKPFVKHPGLQEVWWDT